MEIEQSPHSAPLLPPDTETSEYGCTSHENLLNDGLKNSDTHFLEKLPGEKQPPLPPQGAGAGELALLPSSDTSDRKRNSRDFFQTYFPRRLQLLVRGQMSSLVFADRLRLCVGELVLPGAGLPVIHAGCSLCGTTAIRNFSAVPQLPPFRPHCPRPAHRAGAQLRRETQNFQVVAVLLGKCQEKTPLPTPRHVFAAQRYIFCNPKTCFCSPKVCFCEGEVSDNRARQSLGGFEQQKINKHREGLPWERSEGSSYGNGGLVTASLVLCVPSGSGEAPLDRYHSVLLDVSALVR